MALEIVVTSDRWVNDPASREFVEYLNKNQDNLALADAVLYYDFPSYSDYESEIFRPDLLLFSPIHGFLVIRFFDASLSKHPQREAIEIDESLEEFTSNLHSRLVRSKLLRKTRTSTVIDIHPIIFAKTDGGALGFEKNAVEANLYESFSSVSDFLSKVQTDSLDTSQIAEVRSVVEGAKALSKPRKRIIADPEKHKLAVVLAKLESEISNFDEKQRRIALVDVGGPARIRGLAGSGKTIILAMKAAHLHLNSPNSKILVTFYTKSLRNTIKTLITKFYRLYSDTDPNWKKLHVRHGWGGRSIPGVYSDACERIGHPILSFGDAKRIAKRRETPFAAVCANLLTNQHDQEFYDHVLIDEGQDFPDSFYKLAYRITKGKRDTKSIVWAYDELQDIMNIKIRQPSELFGRDDAGNFLVDLDRSSASVPPGATNDAVLSKAYRNQRNILVTAHALGFGVYGDIVQMLESKEHWEDVGYEVLSGSIVTDQTVKVQRPEKNSPIALEEVTDFPLIESFSARDDKEETSWVAENIAKFIDMGLSPEEILVISLDDRYAKMYLKNISEKLSLNGIASNNVIADPYNEPPFTIQDRVTLSTVYRAKGNEASVVFAVGIDAVELKSRHGRNRIFTAFTRTKAWLRVSGLTKRSQKILKELEMAMGNAPNIIFTMPDLAKIETIQRGFSKKQAVARAAKEAYIKSLRSAGFSDEEVEEELSKGKLDG